MTKNLVLAMQGKGGVQKTTSVSLLAQFLSEAKQKFLLVDADIKPALQKLHPAEKVVRVELETDEFNLVKFETLYEAACNAEERLILIDTPQEKVSQFIEWAQKSEFVDQAKADGVELTFLVPVTGRPDTIENLKTFLTQFKKTVRWVVVVSHVDSYPVVYEGSEERVLAQSFGAEEVNLPVIGKQYISAMQTTGLTVTGLINGRKLPPLTINMLKTWRRQLFESFAATENIKRLIAK